MNKNRNANIELLRVICMLMIMTEHCMAWCGALYEQSGVSYYFYWWLEALCVPAVNVFVLISGFFLVESDFKAENLLRTLGTVWSYSFICSWLCTRMSGQSLNAGTVLQMLLPIATKKYWFVNAYLAMYLLFPFLNRLIRALNRRQFEYLLVVLILIMVVRPTLLPAKWAQDPTNGLSVFFFITLYFMAAWLRLYFRPKPKTASFSYLLWIGVSVGLVFSKWLLLRGGFPEDTAGRFYSYCSVPVVLQACAFFLGALYGRKIPERVNSLIKTLAKTSFAAYIIHYALTTVLWRVVFPVDRYVSRPATGVPAIIIAVLLTYLICFCIESLRMRLLRGISVERYYRGWIEKWNHLLQG